MTIYELKRNYEEKQKGHFFDKETLKFFGQTLSKMRVTKDITVTDYRGNKHNCYCVSATGRIEGKITNNLYYFDSETFEIVHNI